MIRRLAMNIPTDSINSPIVRILLEGYLEIFIASIISLTAFTNYNYINTNLKTKSDIFSLFICIIISIALIWLPINIYYNVNK